MSETRLIGTSPPRPDLRTKIEGRSRCLDDIAVAGALEIAFVRSPHAHATIEAIDSTSARALSGVVAVVTAADIADICTPWTAELTNLGPMNTVPQPALASDVARWQGEPVAAVVAETRAIAEDAAALVEVDYTVLPAVASLDQAVRDEIHTHPELGTNSAWSLELDTGNVDAVFREAAHVIERNFEVGRQTGVTLEPRGMIAEFEPSSGQLTLHQTSQVPHIQRTVYARQLGLSENQVRIVCPDLGGGFGIKLHVYPDEMATAAISMTLKRPVKFVADRTESFLADIHARGHIVNARIAVNADGVIGAMTVDNKAGGGAYLVHPRTSVIEPLLVAICTPLAYTIDHYRARAELFYQNKVMTGQYRGVGMPVATLVAEGMMDAAARALGLDAAEIRRRNLLPDDGYPRTAASGEFLECLSQQAAFDRLLSMMEYDKLRAEQSTLRERGIHRGIGLCCAVEGTAASPALYAAGGAPISSREACTLRLEADGSIACATGLTDQGQGGYAVIAQIAADTLSVPIDTVRVIMGDTATTPFGGGTWASRGTAIAGEA
ncbi:MAG: xanthine dehydrogenase family protein molybdopterin-binding subunit, partial [Gammaproteobacteria bacterium]